MDNKQVNNFLTENLSKLDSQYASIQESIIKNVNSREIGAVTERNKQ